MSAPTDRHAAGDWRVARPVASDTADSAAHTPPDKGRHPGRRALGRELRTLGDLIAGDAPATLPVPTGLLALGALVVYSIVVVAAGGVAGVGLACIPLYIAATVLSARQAFATTLATVVVTIIPPLWRGAWTMIDLAASVEIAILVVAALVLRIAEARLAIAKVTDAARDAHVHDRIQAVLGIAERLTRTFDQIEIFKTIVAETLRVLEADGVTIRILRGDRLEVVAWAGLDDDVASELPAVRPDEGWFAEVFRTRRPWACDDVRATLAAGGEGFYRRYESIHPFAADLVVPLVGNDRVIGAISVVRLVPHHWDEADVEFVAALATHASVAIHNAELYDEAEMRAAQMSVLQAASARMSRQNTVESVGRAIVEETRRIIDYHNARVYVLEPPVSLVPIAFEGTVGAYEKVDLALLRTRLGVGFTGWAAEHGQALLIPDANADPRGSTIPGTDDVDESMLVVPMRYDERVTGAITLSKLGLHQFDEGDLRLLTILADQAAAAVESARLLARTQGLAGELRRLLDMGADLADSLDPREVANLIARHIAGAMGVEQCAISYWDRAEDRILTWGFEPMERPEQVQPEYRLADFPATRAVLERQVTVVVDVDDPAADPAEVALLRRDGDHNLVMLPLVAKGESIGLVEIISRTPVTLDPARVELARTMANEAAMALENAKLYEDARKLADHDQLTGFHNHRYLHERLGEEVVRAQRSGTRLSLLMIDLDDFKLVNDTFGHLFGDRVLVWAAELIRSALRSSDVPARYGGDEFAVVLPDSDPVAAATVADRILRAFHDRPFESELRGPVPLAASIGLATFPVDGRTGQELIAAADAALYRVKAAGGHGATPSGDPGPLPAGRSTPPDQEIARLGIGRNAA